MNLKDLYTYQAPTPPTAARLRTVSDAIDHAALLVDTNLRRHSDLVAAGRSAFDPDIYSVVSSAVLTAAQAVDAAGGRAHDRALALDALCQARMWANKGAAEIESGGGGMNRYIALFRTDMERATLWARSAISHGPEPLDGTEDPLFELAGLLGVALDTNTSVIAREAIREIKRLRGA